MFVNYKMAFASFTGTTTATTINIPFNLEYQIVDNGELVERVFVNEQTQKSVNPILDYDKVRFVPVKTAITKTLTTSLISNITYNLFFLDVNNNMQIPTYYSNVDIKEPYVDDDLKFERNNFKESYLKLSFYDSDNALTQNLVTELDIYSMLTSSDYWTTATLPIPHQHMLMVIQNLLVWYQ